METEMIIPQKGEVMLDGSKLLIHPGMTLASFKAGDVAHRDYLPERLNGQSAFQFGGTLDGVESQFWIFFREERFHLLLWSPLSGPQMHMPKLGQIESWLSNLTGVLPPYEYDWGYIDTETEDLTGQIAFVTKEIVFEKGFDDVRAFYKARREFLQLRRK